MKPPEVNGAAPGGRDGQRLFRRLAEAPLEGRRDGESAPGRSFLYNTPAFFRQREERQKHIRDRLAVPEDAQLAMLAAVIASFADRQLDFVARAVDRADRHGNRIGRTRLRNGGPERLQRDAEGRGQGRKAPQAARKHHWAR
jgi:hypothetical protein